MVLFTSIPLSVLRCLGTESTLPIATVEETLVCVTFRIRLVTSVIRGETIMASVLAPLNPASVGTRQYMDPLALAGRTLRTSRFRTVLLMTCLRKGWFALLIGRGWKVLKLN